MAQLKKNYPHLRYESIRGNLNTRLRKLEEDDKYSAIILAVAGVDRMGWSKKITEVRNSICTFDLFKNKNPHVFFYS